MRRNCVPLSSDYAMRSSYLVLPPNSSRVTIAWNEIPATGGDGFPKWSRNGKELSYHTQDNKIMVATYTASGDSFHAYKPRLWSSGSLALGSILILTRTSTASASPC
jgi:hypothetical protein